MRILTSGGKQPIIMSLLLQKEKQDMLLSAQTEKASFSLTPHIFLLKIQNECWPCKNVRKLRKEDVWSLKQILLWRTNWVSNFRRGCVVSTVLQGCPWLLISPKRAVRLRCWERSYEIQRVGNHLQTSKWSGPKAMPLLFRSNSE